MTGDVIQVQGLSCDYWDEAVRIPALADVSVDIGCGGFVVVAGPNGAGKTTLLNCMSGVIPRFVPARLQGQVLVNGRPVQQYAIPELARTMGIVLQDAESQLFGSVARRFLAFGLELMGFERQEALARVEHAARLMGVLPLMDRNIQSLSGGEKQRLVVASVLVLQPSIVLLDEPTSQLDPQGVRELVAALKGLNRQIGLTVVMASHNLSEVCDAATHLLVLDRGSVRAYGEFRLVLGREMLQMVRYPQAAELYHACKGDGLPVGAGCPLTVEEGTDFARSLLGAEEGA